MATTESALSQDVVFEVLSNPRRRYILYHLRTTGETVQLTDLAEEVAAWENDSKPSEITEQERKRVYVSLYQTHIPKLAEVGLVEYDKDSGRIALAERAMEMDKYLTVDDQYSWQQVYLLLSAGSVALVVLATVLDAIPELVVSIVIVSAFLLSITVHVGTQLLNRRSVPDELSMK